jgi:DNA polymerase III alpha subunit
VRPHGYAFPPSGISQLAKACKSYGIKPVFGIELFVRGLNGKGHYPLRFVALDNEGLKKSLLPQFGIILTLR